MKTIVPILLTTLTLVVFGCVGENSMDGEPGPNGGPICSAGQSCCKPEEMVCTGDPDSPLLCSCYKSWACDSAVNPKKCTQKPADKPDGEGGWSCQVQGGTERCTRAGDQVPTGKNGWTCAKGPLGVECSRPTNTPDGGGSWSCAFDDAQTKTCKKGTPPTSDAGVPPKSDSKVPPTADSKVPPKQDSGAPTGWNCFKDALGDDVCVKKGEGLPPGGGSWKCQWQAGMITCDGGGGSPPGGGGWTCVPRPEVGGWQCKKPQGSGDVPGGGGWSCTSSTELGGIQCVKPPPKTPGAECVPGQKMWCDGVTYCGYGQVICAVNGKWKTKLNPSTGKQELDCNELADGRRPNTMCACYFFYFNNDCCETPDCIVPVGTNGQICPASKGGYCDYCNPQSPECKAAGAKCILTPKAESFCGQDCSGGKACPAGSQCVQAKSGGQTFYQCVPSDQSCYY